MSRLVSQTTPGTHGFPRVSGDEPALTDRREAGKAFSPRERG